MAPDDTHLLDTSALLTFLEDEAGADRVEDVLRAGGALVPFLALLEVYYITLQERDEAEADLRYALLKQLKITVLWEMNEHTLLMAARFKAAHRLSLADAMIAAFARRNNAVLLHKDPEYEALRGHVRMEALPYKGGTS